MAAISKKNRLLAQFTTEVNVNSPAILRFLSSLNPTRIRRAQDEIIIQ